MAKADYYTVIESLAGTLDGVDVEYHKGEVVAADDPALKAWPWHFGPLVVREYRRAAVEQATAAPGEQRHSGKAITTAGFRGR